MGRTWWRLRALKHEFLASHLLASFAPPSRDEALCGRIRHRLVLRDVAEGDVCATGGWPARPVLSIGTVLTILAPHIALNRGPLDRQNCTPVHRERLLSDARSGGRGRYLRCRATAARRA